MGAPLLAPAVNETVAWPTALAVEATATLVMAGAPGGPTGITEDDAAEADPVPAALVAVTVNVYAAPSTRPLTRIGLEAPVPTWPPLLVTVYEVMAAPLLAGALNATEADPSLGVTPVIAGAPGAPAGTTPLLEGDDAAEVPAAFVAVTVNV